MVNRVLYIAAAAVLLMVEPVRADILWNLPGAHTGTLGTSQSFTSVSGGYDLTAYGYTSTEQTSTPPQSLTLTGPTDLYGKNGGSGETGVGIASDTQHEVNTTSAVALDLSKSYKPGDGNVTITIGSVQNTEGFAVFGGSLPVTTPTLGAPYKLTDYLGQVTNNGSNNTVYTFTVTANEMATANDVLYVTATSHNVVIESINIASVPEPGTITMLLTGLASVTGLGWYRRRKAS